ncbi:Mur ligase family protein [Sulfurospirillum arcachonense]|uniref:Mur ligase family protein n=1 Tax=Sulfurospirillum arcachonense TaxID=57666 RepID=UPI0004685701|nr:UDP-N-acetylmuramoyl-tripeptide--D-alanyl-D-alanine ligase [Sulfurospirillum arcachonense]
MEIFEFISHLFFVLVVGYYVISALQWYSYKLERVVFHYKRYDWHLFFFIIPIFVYYLAQNFFWIYLYLILVPTLYLWYRKLDKKLVFTGRVKRFFLFLFLATIFQNLLCLASSVCMIFGVILPIFATLFLSMLFEKLLFIGFKKSAKKNLEDRKDLTIIAITASFGKTSIKNYLYQILTQKYNCYMTPRSVNTLGGIMKDINDDLPSDAQIYIVEAGARLKGDINEIVELINPHYAIVGKIGEQHIEYFKTLENIRNTKMELLNSNRLKQAYVHVSANIKADEKTVEFGNELSNVKSTLDGLYFDVKLDGKIESFYTPLLGEFNAMNLLACIYAAKSHMSLEEIKNAIANLKGVDHRLQKLEVGGKLILDDSFNGNLEGMVASYDLASTYEGRKVIITPGIVESTESANEELAKKIDEVFDVVILTGKSNLEILSKNITKAEKVIVEDKTTIEDVLKEFTCKGDLILFSNDTPSFM